MKKILYPLLALLLGLAGYLLRAQQLRTAIDSDTGLLLLHHPLSYAMIGLTAGAALILLIVSLFVSNEPRNWYGAFHTTNPLPQVFSFAAALGFGVSTILIVLQLLPYGFPQALLTQPFLFFFGLLMIFACLSVFLLALRNGDHGSTSLTTLIPGFTCCVWLVLLYHSNASNPSVLSFTWQLLAVVTACLAWYYTASFAFQHPHPRLTGFFCLMTVVLCMIALADRTDLYQKVLMASTGLWFLGRSILFLSNAQYDGKRTD